MERKGRGVFAPLSFAALAERSRRVAAGLRARGASPRRPVVVTLPNGTARALVTAGAWRAGVPVVALSPRWTNEEVREMATFVGAAAVVDETAVASFERHAATVDDAGGGDAVAQLVPCGRRDGVPLLATTTHENVCAMLEGLMQRWAFLADRPAVIVDGRPWSGFGANVVLGLALRCAGTVFVEDAAGDPELRGEIAPTIAFDVPARWTAWLRRLRGDEALQRRWLSRLRLACWNGAPIDPGTRDGLRALGVPLASLWGAATTASAIATTLEREPGPAALGAPLAGVELKLVPRDGAYEARVRGPQVMPGYWWSPEATAAAFDEEGFLRLGDLVRPLDPRRPERGLLFAGRDDGSFTLGDGTRVDAPRLQAAFLAACPDAESAAIVAFAETELGVLVVRDPGAAIGEPLLRAEVAAALRAVGARRALFVDTIEPARRATALRRLAASEPDAEVILA